jgi:hypothetical protein
VLLRNPGQDDGRRPADAAFFGIGARLSDLDKLQGRLIICVQTNWRAISFDADLRPIDLSRRRRARNAAPPRPVIQLGPADDLAIIATS